MFEWIGIIFIVVCSLVGLSLILLWCLARYEDTALWLMQKAYKNLIFAMSDEKFNMFLNRLKSTREEYLKKKK